MTQAYKNFIPEYWSKKLVKNYDATGVMMQCVNRDYEKELKEGDTANIQTFGNISVKDYEGTVTYEQPLESTQQLIMDQKKFFGFKVPDVDKVQSNIKLVDGYMGRSKVEIELVKDTFLLSKHADVLAANTIGTTGVPIALTKDNVYGYLKSLGKILKLNNAFKSKDGKAAWIVVDPTIEDLLTSSPEFISANNPAIVKDTLIEGSCGKVSGMNILVCTNFVSVASKYYIMAGTNDAITFGSQIEQTEALRDQDSFNDLVRGLYVYGAKTVAPKALAKLIATIA